jgi:predicted alpha-1,2-mannosidase
MLHIRCHALAVALLAAACATAGRYTRYVNPFIGTGAVENSLSGNCYPGATVPFGMVQLSPDTQEAPDWDKASGYDYNDTHTCGFSHTRLSGTGACDLIDLLLMPTTTDEVWSAVDHSKEAARPGYYSLRLSSGILAELTATTRAGIHRYTYPAGSRQRLYIDLDHSAPKTSWNRRIIQSQLRVVAPNAIEGYRIITGWAKLRRVYFRIELSRPIASCSLIDGSRDYGQVPVVNGTALKAWLDFDPKGGNELTVKVALSTTSIENARLNMQREAASWSFDGYAAQADKAWDDVLGRIEAEGNRQDMEKFYTALYHTMIQPNTISDVDGSYTATDYSTRRMPEGRTYYTTFSLWDTFRAAHPLYIIIAPERNADFVNSMLTHFDSYGYLPIWSLWGQDNYCMIGNHAIPVVVDAVMKDTPGIDPERALNACVASATTSHPGSPFDVWEKYGYMPEDLQSQSVSITLEQAYDDWCVAQLAKKLGHDDIYERFTRRARYFRNLYNADNGFFQGRTSDGKWLEPFDPLRYGANGGNPYTEGNAWQYSWYVPHDIEGLIELMGGKRKFVERLDRFFTLTEQSGRKNDNASGFIGQYVHGNEPSHHVAYLYGYAGEPRKTQYYVHKICTELYNTSSSGYAGNDDCGEMSAWLVFSAMGFYPVNPASGEYALGTPMMDKVTVHLAGGRTFTVNAHRKDSMSFYVKSVRLDGRKYDRNTISHKAITDGGTLDFYLE